MSQGLITVEAAKSNFFDRALVQNAIGKERAGALAKSAAFVRTDMRRSIKPSRRLRLDEMPDEMRAQYKGRPAKDRPLASSAPGEAPRGRTKRLKGSILFAFDSRSKSALVGPARLPSSRSPHAPRVLEEGGQSTVLVPNRRTKKSGRKPTEAQFAGFKKAQENGKLEKSTQPRSMLEIPVTVNPRPYVGPALRKNLNRIPRGFRNLIRNT